MGHKAAETIRSINAFGPGTDNIQCSGCPRSFTEEKRALQMSRLASHRKLTTTSWVIIENDPPTMTLEIAKNPTSTILPLFGIWSKLERWKSSISGCLVSWPKILKITILKCHLLLFYGNMFVLNIYAQENVHVICVCERERKREAVCLGNK